MDFATNIAKSSSVDAGHQMFAPIHLQLFNSPFNGAAELNVKEKQEQPLSPPPVLDCYASAKLSNESNAECLKIQPNQNDSNDDGPSTLTKEVATSAEEGQEKDINSTDQCLKSDQKSNAFTEVISNFSKCINIIDETEPTTSSQSKPKVEKPATRRDGKASSKSQSENIPLRRSERQIKRKWKDSQSTEGDSESIFKFLMNSSFLVVLTEKGIIHIGESFQAEVPKWTDNEKPLEYGSDSERECCMWKNNEKLDDFELEEYFQATNREAGVDLSTGLRALKCHNYDIDVALENIEKYQQDRKRPFSAEEQRLFFKGLTIYGKNFSTIHNELLPARKIWEIVEYYYDTKHTSCFGCIKKCCPKLLHLDMSDQQKITKSECDNCLGNIKNSSKVPTSLCGSCSLYLRRNKKMRPIFNYDKGIMDEVVTNKAKNGRQRHLFKSSAASLVSSSSSQPHACSFTSSKIKKLQAETRWTPYETEAAVKAFYTHGKDFQAVSAAIGTKSVAEVKKFFIEKQHAYRLDFVGFL
uniref:ELM2 domain-containing protein n=1 Tax=Syphacia muris TaxID=451379 RepID=A0A158R687_9BILA